MQTLRYGPHAEQVADLHRPDGEAPDARSWPVAVLLHGGFWRAQYGRDIASAQAGDLAAHGWAALNVEYRRLDLGGGWPETGTDVLAAIGLLAGQAGLDLSRVVPVGHSAGGQLALWAAAASGRTGSTAGLDRVPLAGAVSLGGVVDLERAAELNLGDGVVRRYLGGSPAQATAAYAEASPRRRLPLGVPLLLVHGEQDDIVPAGLSADLARAAGAAGDQVDLVVRSEDDHFTVVDVAGEAWAQVRAWLGRCFP